MLTVFNARWHAEACAEERPRGRCAVMGWFAETAATRRGSEALLEACRGAVCVYGKCASPPRVSACAEARRVRGARRERDVPSIPCALAGFAYERETYALTGSRCSFDWLPCVDTHKGQCSSTAPPVSTLAAKSQSIYCIIYFVSIAISTAPPPAVLLTVVYTLVSKSPENERYISRP